MHKPGLDESQAGTKTAGRNISHLRYADDTTPLAESKQELKSLLMKVKEEWKGWLKLNIQKTKIVISGPITSWQIDGEKVETVTDFIFLKSYDQPRQCIKKQKHHFANKGLHSQIYGFSSSYVGLWVRP